MTTPKEILVDGLQEFAKKVGGKSRNGKRAFLLPELLLRISSHQTVSSIHLFL